jgi:hypothetical protein
MGSVLGDAYLEDIRRQFHGQKKLAEKAMNQVSDELFFAVLDRESNSIALVVKHIAGNLRSRWLDFYDSDGEKPDRHRDAEFEIVASDTRVSLMEAWNAAWTILFDVVDPMTPQDLERTVTIRGEPHVVVRAVNRQLAHYAYHVGQIVFLAKHYAADHWQTLSVPRGQSEQLNARLRSRAVSAAADPKS